MKPLMNRKAALAGQNSGQLQSDEGRTNHPKGAKFDGRPKLKVLIGQIFHEGNSMNERPTEEADFIIYYGHDILTHCAGNGSALGGILDMVVPAYAEIIPSVSACASPGGPIEQACWEKMRDEILRSAARASPDVVLLDLHGAMISNETADPEGELIGSLRSILGPNVLIGVGLDLHGHITDTMCQAADVLIACKNNPHDDYYQTGQRVTRICLDAATKKIKPLLSRVHIPMILFGNDETSGGPLFDLNKVARDFEADGVLDISIFNVQAMLDVPDMGQVITAVTNNDPRMGAIACETLARQLLAREPEFKTDHLEIDDLWPILKQPHTNLPFAVSDFGDRVLAGATGDGVQILREAHKRPEVKAAIPVTDIHAARALQNHAVGETVQISLGGCYSQVEPINLTAVVQLHHDGRFVLDGPWLAGLQANHGLTTVLQLDRLVVVVTERPAYSQDFNFFASLELDINKFDFVVCKSGFHFKLSFAKKAIPLTIGTSGIGQYDPNRIGMRRKPVWPETDETPKISEVAHFNLNSN